MNLLIHHIDKQRVTLSLNESFDLALGSFENALEIESDYQDALYSKAMCLFYLERYDEALKFSNEVLVKHPSRSSCYEYQRCRSV